MDEKNLQIVRKEYTKEGLVQQLALMKIQTEIHELKTYEIGSRFTDYYNQFRAQVN